MRNTTSFKNAFQKLSSEERFNSKKKILISRTKDDDLWLFGYGSLMWNPCILYKESKLGVLIGYHRDFCVWTQLARGTGKTPGLALGLKKGGSCQGLLFRIAAPDVETELQKVWEREMYTDIYTPIWLSVQTTKETVNAVTFIINTSHEQYAKDLSIKEKVFYITSAHGENGSCLEYFLNTIKQLNDSNIADPNLDLIHEAI